MGPANETFTISSGYVHEPRATLIIRTGVAEAKVYRVPHTERLLISLAPHGLKVDTTDKVEVSTYCDPHAIPGHDTAPMLLRGESFRHSKNVAESSIKSTTCRLASHPEAQTVGNIDREAV